MKGGASTRWRGVVDCGGGDGDEDGGRRGGCWRS